MDLERERRPGGGAGNRPPGGFFPVLSSVGLALTLCLSSGAWQGGEASAASAAPQEAEATGGGDAGVGVAEGDVAEGDVADGDLEDGDLEDGDLEDGDLEDGDLEDGDLDDDQVLPPLRVEPPAPVLRDGFVRAPVFETLEAGGRNRTDYVIRARVEPLEVDGEARYALKGTETLRWTNGSDDAVGDLWFHLYLNAFANNRSTHLTAARGRLRGHQLRDGWGWSEIEAVALVGADGSTVDLTPTLTWEQPTDANPADRTVFRVELPEPVAPGATATVRVEWTSRLPRVRRRTGTKDDFLLVSQWFPKLAVYEGGRGWNAHQFHAFSEWYADFGTYDVTLDLPAEFADRVFASGVETRALARGERVEVSFAAPSLDDRERVDPLAGRAPLVHDFMWTADPDYFTKTSTFRFDEWARRFPDEIERARRAFGDEAVERGLREVTVQALIQPEREVQADRHLEATEAALFFYGLWFGEYPFERLTVVDPAWGASAAGGMEYPTIFTAGTRLFTQPWMHSPEGVTVHEAGHQWFYLLSGNNEFEAAWLDEGLNSYADSEVIARVWGDRKDTTTYAGVPVKGVRLLRVGGGGAGAALALRRVPFPPLEWVGLDDFTPLRPVRSSGFVDWWRDQPLLTAAPREGDPRWSDRGGYLSSPDRDPIDNWAWKSMDRGSHYTNSYSRTATVLRSTPAYLSAATGEDGDVAFLRGMRAFARDWRFRHPYPDDFFAAFEAGDGLDLELDRYFDDLFRGTGTVDWSLEVDQRRRSDALGAFMGDDGRFALIDDDGKGPTDVDGEGVLDDAAAAAEDGDAGDAGDAGDDGGDVEDGEGGETAEDEPSDASAVPPGAEDGDPDRPWLVTVTVKRDGALALPVLVRLEFEDGAIEEFTWTREEQVGRRWIQLTYASASRLKSAAVDPDRGYFIDTDRSNNEWYAESESITPLRWAERVFSQAAHTLHWYKGLGG